ncbi:HipA N-terminal domain-containing protein [Deinococcus frigens]|uniref:HipA N-terminal domain-containing protein n=1 Tax=Deinococcus frigens TaxID=249403 RepID=UPI0039EE63C3
MPRGERRACFSLSPPISSCSAPCADQKDIRPRAVAALEGVLPDGFAVAHQLARDLHHRAGGCPVHLLALSGRQCGVGDDPVGR